MPFSTQSDSESDSNPILSRIYATIVRFFYIDIYVYIYICVYIHTQTHSHTHTHTQVRTAREVPSDTLKDIQQRNGLGLLAVPGSGAGGLKGTLSHVQMAKYTPRTSADVLLAGRDGGGGGGGDDVYNSGSRTRSLVQGQGFS